MIRSVPRKTRSFRKKQVWPVGQHGQDGHEDGQHEDGQVGQPAAEAELAADEAVLGIA